MLLDLNFLSYSFLIAALSSFLLGIAKAGVKGIAALIVAGLALAYGAKESTGILMPLIYEAAGVHKKAIALATSFASPKRFAGTEALITPAISSSDFPCF